MLHVNNCLKDFPLTDVETRFTNLTTTNFHSSTQQSFPRFFQELVFGYKEETKKERFFKVSGGGHRTVDEIQ
jgi:hypothetical protein